MFPVFNNVIWLEVAVFGQSFKDPGGALYFGGILIFWEVISMPLLYLSTAGFENFE